MKTILNKETWDAAKISMRRNLSNFIHSGLREIFGISVWGKKSMISIASEDWSCHKALVLCPARNRSAIRRIDLRDIR
jgi:hypothetical protein